jgi:uncharacterized protein (DUF2062 family)
MPREFIKRYLPTPEKLNEFPALRPLGKLVHSEDLWHLNRRSAAGAAFIGFFCAFLPMPFQMLPAAALAVMFRCNLPISLALCWLTNPLTMAPMFWFSYELGSWLLGREISSTDIDLSTEWILDNLTNVGYPLIFGSMVCGWVLGLTSFVLIRVLWRLHIIRRWKERRSRRAVRS